MTVQQISVTAFEEMVQENMEDFDLDRLEAITETIQQLKTQKIPISNLKQFLDELNCKKIDEQQKAETTTTETEHIEENTIEPHIEDDREFLYFQCDADLKTSQERRQRVNYDKGSPIKLPFKTICLVTSRVARVAYAGGASGTIRKINLDTGKITGIFTGHAGPVSSLCLCESAGILISGSWDKKIMVWNLDTFEKQYELVGHEDFIKSICFHAGTNTIYSGSSDKSVKEWSHLSKSITRTFPRSHRRPVEALCVNELNSVLYSACSFGTIIAWDLKTKDILHEFTGHDTSVYGIALDEEGQRLFSASADHSVKRWDLEIAKCTLTIKHPDWVRDITIWPGTSALITGCRDGHVRLFDADDGELLETFVGHYDEASCVQFSSSENDIISGSLDGTLRRWVHA